MLVTLALGKLRQEDNEFEVILGYIVRPGVKKAKTNNKQIKIKVATFSKWLHKMSPLHAY
jgi:hypothetical protein